MERIERIAAALDANGVGYDPDFYELDARGYASDACQSFSEEIIGDLEDLTARCIGSGGVGSREKEAIADLIKLALKLSDRKAPDKLAKYAETKKKILAGAETPARREAGMSIKEEAMKYITSSIKGAEVVSAMNIGEGQKALFARSAEILKETEETVKEVWDDSSISAADVAGEMVDLIIRWRKKLSVYMCDSVAVSDLEAALEKAKAWKALNVAPKKRNIAKEDYIKEKVGYSSPNDVERIIDSVGRKEGLCVFVDALKRFDEETERRFGTQALEAERDALHAEKEEKTNEVKSLSVQYRNGEISAELSLSKIKRLQRELEDCEERIEEVEGEIAEKDEGRSDRDGIRREFQKLSDRILEFENDPAMFTTLSKNIDLVELSGVLLGRKSAEELKDVASRILAVFDMIKVHGGFTEEARESWRDIRRELKMEKEREREREPKRPAVNSEQKKKQAEEEMEALLKEMGLDGGAKQEQKKPRVEEAPEFIPLSENDK